MFSIGGFLVLPHVLRRLLTPAMSPLKCVEISISLETRREDHASRPAGALRMPFFEDETRHAANLNQASLGVLAQSERGRLKSKIAQVAPVQTRRTQEKVLPSEFAKKRWW
jgi:hypothetical protein